MPLVALTGEPVMVALITEQETARREGDRVVIGRITRTTDADGEILEQEYEDVASVYLQ